MWRETGAVVIRRFRDDEARKIFEGERSRRLPADVQSVMRRKLKMLDAAVELADLRVPPGNRLEPLKADRAGQYSIRVNDRWRICFRWTPAGPTDVEIADYH